MQKLIKEQILQMIETIIYAHKTIQQLFQDNQYQTIIGLLSDCQSSAVAIGTALEEHELSCDNIIIGLEEYCEYLYQISLQIDRFSRQELEQEILTLEKSIRQIGMQIEKAVLVTYEVTFMPYKASMWDCMESIWRAACRDSRCVCSVVPIPYFLRNPDGSVGKLEYEGSEFPTYVPIIFWQDYDLSTRKPDVIYIHNPYDHCNHVTTVYPDYFSINLKKYTDMLVYVPYFVATDSIESHFCSYLPGIKNADRVIVQSEKIRKEYLKYWSGKKIVALGSPKIDKALNITKEVPDIPAEWKNLIADKRVIFLNTHLDKLLNYQDVLLDKLRYIFSCFEGREDILLIWRPHPLSQSTISSMRPQFLTNYENLVWEYQDKKIGIYDTSPDMYQAIGISDGYLGDWSSLVPIYGITGKPVMIQDMAICSCPNEVEQKSFVFGDAYLEGSDLYFSSMEFNSIFKMDLNTYEVELLDSFYSESFYMSVTKYKNKLFFAPSTEADFAVYDLSAKKCHYLKTDTFTKNIANDMRFGYVPKLIYKNYVFFLKRDCSEIVRIDLECESITCYHDWYGELTRLVHNKAQMMFVHQIVHMDDSLYIPVANTNIIFEFNMETGSYNLNIVGDKNKAYTTICYDGTDFWLAQNNTLNLIKWNKESGLLLEYTNFPAMKSGLRNPTGFICCQNGGIWLFSWFSNMVLRFDLKTEKVIIINDWREDSTDHAYSYAYPLDENHIMTCDYGQKILRVYDTITFDYEERYLLNTSHYICEDFHNRDKKIFNSFLETIFMKVKELP